MEVSDYIQQLQVLQDKNGSVEVVILDKENGIEYSLNELVFDAERGTINISIGLGGTGTITIPGPPPGGIDYINRTDSGSSNKTLTEIRDELRARQQPIPPVRPADPIRPTRKE